MTLGEKQRLFTRLVADLIVWAYDNDYELSFSEAYRTPEQAAINARRGKGIINSLHTKRLAVDLNLFVDITPGGDEDVYATQSEAYRALGDKWKAMHPLARWGGDFYRADGNHFSLEHDGVR